MVSTLCITRAFFVVLAATGGVHGAKSHKGFRKCYPRMQNSGSSNYNTPTTDVGIGTYDRVTETLRFSTINSIASSHPISATTGEASLFTGSTSKSFFAVNADITTIIDQSFPTAILSLSATNTIVAVASNTLITPQGIKAGIAGGDAYPFFKNNIGWWYDWTPKPTIKSGKPIAVPMLWGGGSADQTDARRLAQFEVLVARNFTPAYVLGFEEPDCPSGSGSAGMSVEEAVSKWETLIAPMRRKGTLLGSPSMCKQADETWLAEFEGKISTPWDFTAIHVNKNSVDGAKKDIDYYWNTYGKPIWITEFACVDDFQGFIPCTDQEEINTFINDVVPFFEDHPNVYAYAYSNGLGLGDVWPLMQDSSSLSESGKVYLAAISQYH